MIFLHIISSLTFGRDSARYFELLALMAIVSISLWIIVIVSTIIRFGLRLAWRRHFNFDDADDQNPQAGDLS